MMLRQPPEHAEPAPVRSAAARPAGTAGSPAPSGTVLRFTRAVRWCHHATAVLMALCVGTALCLYVPGLAELVGRRALVVTVHEWSGLALPVPLLLGLASRPLRADLRRLNRFGPHDRRWLRAALRARRPYPGRWEQWDAGKFNAGQKVFAAWIAGAVLVMTGTGLLMWFTGLTPLVWRTSATFVHDWLALAVGGVLAAHVAMAVAHPEARTAMRTGMADRAWARREHPLWEPADADADADSGCDADCDADCDGDSGGGGDGG
ncbi:cytochrome b/b6 domain-containing protein [Streptomyces ovatisporus]|uniref:Cytochrome b/b6 domain-containing protein n=1 Tax=Streptomyces ovatisporus TaxID=1128682 RepID=A0ABV9A2E8_9ACTN